MNTLTKVALAALAAAAVTVPTTSPTPAPVVTVAAPTAARVAPAARTAATTCTIPAPTTARGYRAMLDAVPDAQWGAADVSISTRIADGRVVWLYGDTFSTGRFVHSTAIVQTRGCLHVSRGGAQLLPNTVVEANPTKARPTIIYWISAAKAHGTGLDITARRIAIFGRGVWDFRDTGYQRTFSATVTAAGDVAATFARSVGAWTPAPDPGPFYAFGDNNPHHFGYSRHTHPEARLASGRMLVTTCQNWDDGVLHPFAAYRPVFTER